MWTFKKKGSDHNDVIVGFELCQEATGVVTGALIDAGVEPGAYRQIAYFSLFLDTFQQLGLLEKEDAVVVSRMYEIHAAKETGEDVRDIVARLRKIMTGVRVSGPNGIEIVDVTKYLYVVERDLGDGRDDEIAKILPVADREVRHVIKTIVDGM